MGKGAHHIGAIQEPQGNHPRTLVAQHCGRPHREGGLHTPPLQLARGCMADAGLPLYKYMSGELKDKMTETGNILTRSVHLPEEIQEYRPPVNHEELIGDTTLQKLNEIFNDIMKRTVDRVDPIRSQYGNIVRDEVDVERKTIYIEEYIKSRKHFSFRELLEKQNSKLEIVVTFLVILELMKTGKVTVVQEDLFDDIFITSQEVTV